MNNKLTVTTRFSPELIEQTLDLGTDDLVASKARQVIQLQDQGIRDALTSLGWLAPDETEQLRQQLAQAQADVARLREALTWSLGKLSFVAPLAGGKYNYIRAFEKASTALQETPADAFIKIKQAEAVVEFGHDIVEGAKGDDIQDGDFYAEDILYMAERYAQRLRGEVSDD